MNTCIYTVSWVYDRIGRTEVDRMVYGEWENLYIMFVKYFNITYISLLYNNLIFYHK